VSHLAPGSYIVLASVAGFADFASQPIQLAAGQVMHVKISMAMAVEQQSVTVTDESPAVNVEAGGNASAIVLKGKDLDALSDDPDELSNELTALAGPSAGPNGGQIYIDGFSGGQLPPKSAIREIRINQNPFSAEFDHIGYGRIEILTKPGTDKLHGQVFMQGNDKAFNTGNPYSRRSFPPITATSSTARRAARSPRRLPSLSAPSSATRRASMPGGLPMPSWTTAPAQTSCTTGTGP
jgi:hypothetical protein